MSVTYRNLPKDFDPIAFLFGDHKITVPESYFTPIVTARFYERALKMVPVKSLHNKSAGNPHGLVSLPSMLRYEPGYYGAKWLKLEAAKEVIDSALPIKTPYQLQYLVLFGFNFPKWKNMPLVPSQDKHLGNHWKVMAEVESVALIYGKNEQLYIVTARWKPEKGYLGGGEEPLFLEDGPYVFSLEHLLVEPVEWNDSRVIEGISEGHWSDYRAFRAHLRNALSGTAYILESRGKHMRRAADHFDRISIYPDR